MAFRQVTRICVIVRVVKETGPRSESLAVVVGQNCKRIRSASGVTQNMLAKDARNNGLRWTASKVGDFESGRTAPTFATVLSLSIALSHATGTNVTLADLVRFDGFVKFNDERKVPGRKVVDALRGKPWQLTAEDAGIPIDDVKVVLADAFHRSAERPARYGDLLIEDRALVERRSGLDEERLAKRLGIHQTRLAESSLYLWGHSFSDERDRLAGPDANAQKRGRVSRTLQVQLEQELARGDD